MTQPHMQVLYRKVEAARDAVPEGIHDPGLRPLVDIPKANAAGHIDVCLGACCALSSLRSMQYVAWQLMNQRQSSR